MPSAAGIICIIKFDSVHLNDFLGVKNYLQCRRQSDNSKKINKIII